MRHPTGTITIVFTDVQGSTDLWDRLGERFRPILIRHNAVMRDTITRYDGYEVKTEGDAFMVAFQLASDAVAFALDVQCSMDFEFASIAEFPDEHLRIRIGMHTGEPIPGADPTTGRMDYFGPAVNRAARIAAAGHGGQTLASQITIEAAGAALRECDAEVIDLGQHRFRGLSTSLNVFQILPPSAAGTRFPQLDSLNEIPTNP